MRPPAAAQQIPTEVPGTVGVTTFFITNIAFYVLFLKWNLGHGPERAQQQGQVDRDRGASAGCAFDCRP